MLNIAIGSVALVFLLGLVAYILILITNNSRALTISRNRGNLELELLKAQVDQIIAAKRIDCLLYTSPSPRDRSLSRMPSSA